MYLYLIYVVELKFELIKLDRCPFHLIMVPPLAFL